MYIRIFSSFCCLMFHTSIISFFFMYKCTINMTLYTHFSHCTSVHISQMHYDMYTWLWNLLYLCTHFTNALWIWNPQMHYDIVYTFQPLYLCTQIWCTNSLWIYNCINILLRFYGVYVRNKAKILLVIWCIHYTIYTNISLSTCTLIHMYTD